ncbi:right-handed parallel beta-helix repeat-containing protein [Hwanghaeella grinnelliae]|uniref:right-handed parallel beta-helix repeat-containing protein n=1 Tax=Hwanghaeella grinnelliae TaxID=2500179 RepID=UPI0013866F0E|nr:right-handed parallel beta-helix repeat-containing protein [Hwanghaeella grinnelliae]
MAAVLLASCSACSTVQRSETVCVLNGPGTATSNKVCYSIPDGLTGFLAGGHVRSGATVLLTQGNYGNLTIHGLQFKEQVTLSVEPGQNATFESITIERSSNFTVRGVEVSQRGKAHTDSPLVYIDEASRNIVLENLLVQSAPSVEGWGAQKWRKLARNGIVSFGQDVEIKNNQIRNVRHGIVSAGDRSQITQNRIVNFSGDGIRGLGNDSSYLRNSIRNCFKVDGNHDDGFQSWSLSENKEPGKGVVKNVVLRGNLILNYADEDQPLKCRLQGIGLFDGIYEDWIIEDNTVIVEHWHGITVMGARNVRISQNTVVDRNPLTEIAPWITITRHKDGRKPSGGEVSSNVIMRVNRERGDSSGHKFGLYQDGVHVVDNIELDRSDVRVFVSADGQVDVLEFAQGKSVGARNVPEKQN